MTSSSLHPMVLSLGFKSRFRLPYCNLSSRIQVLNRDDDWGFRSRTQGRRCRRQTTDTSESGSLGTPGKAENLGLRDSA